MSNTIDPGTIACVPGTLSGDVYAVLSSYYSAAELVMISTLLKRVAFSMALGWTSNVVASIDDTKYLQVDAGQIVGGTGGTGSGAPTDAEYLVGALHAGLSAERLVTDTATVAWDLGTPGAASASVPAATTSAVGVVELATDGESAVGVVVQGNDARLSDARTPLAHAAAHQEGGSDEINVAGLSGVLSDAQPPIPTAGVDTIALHSSIAGEIAAIANKAVPVGADYLLIEDSAAANVKRHVLVSALPAATPTAHASSHQEGGTDEISVAGLSGLLATAQTPTAHAASHLSGGLDSIKIDDLAPGDDNTDLDSSLAAHGLLRKLTGVTTDFLRADGAWAAPAGGSGLTHPQVMARTMRG